MNEKNLIPLNQRSQRKRKEIARMGALASNKKQAEKRAMKELLESLLSLNCGKDEDLNKLKEYGSKDKSYKSRIAVALIEKATSGQNGDMKAIELILNITGENEKKEEENKEESTIEALKNLEIKIIDGKVDND